MKIGVISDTHIPGRAKRLPDEVHEAFAGVELVIHAGDIVDRLVLDELSVIAPVRAVMGNCDPHEIALPDEDIFAADGVQIGVTHIPGPKAGLRERMVDRFPGCRVVIFGHTHTAYMDDDGRLLLLNPGTACEPRFGATERSVAILEVSGGEVSVRFVRY